MLYHELQPPVFPQVDPAIFYPVRVNLAETLSCGPFDIGSEIYLDPEDELEIACNIICVCHGISSPGC